MDSFACSDCGSTDLIVEKEWWLWEGPFGRHLYQKFLLDELHHFNEMVDDEVLEHETDWHRADEDHDDDSDYEVEDDAESYEFWVRCDGCNREVEFGWSHEDRGGRIWPSECSDFNPWKCFPEPRYEEVWASKGWLRPARLK